MTKDRIKLLILPGDGIGPEIVEQALKVIDIIKKNGIMIETETELIGGAAIDQYGIPITREVIQKADNADAVILGAVGGTKWESLPADLRPEQGLLSLRKALNLYANIRPVKVLDSLLDSSTLKKEIIKGVDFVVVRELTGGIYFGEPRGIDDNKAFNTEIYFKNEIERIARIGFQIARKRKKKLVSVDKANVLESSMLWRKVVAKIHKDYPDIQLSHQYVDNCAMQIIKNPRQFDVILTNNIFGDILSDESAMLTGSIGMLASASLGPKNSLYEPVHGSAPDIAGKDIANPCAEILCIAMMFDYTFNRAEISRTIKNAVEDVLNQGFRTPDIAQANSHIISTSKIGDKIARRVKELLPAE